MSDLALAFHTAQEAALRGSAALAAAMGPQLRLYSVVPTNSPLPMVVIGQDQIILEPDEECADEGEIFATVHLWARPEPPQATTPLEIGAAVVAALLVPLTLDGHEVVEWELVSADYSTDPDHSTHGVLVFRYLTTAIVT